MEKASKNWQRGKGSGFVMDDGRRAVIRCPECGRENYCLNVTSGICCWCGHNENETTPNPPMRRSR